MARRRQPMRVAWRLTPAARSHQQMIKLHVKDGPLLQQHKPRRPPATYGRLDGNGSPDGEVSGMYSGGDDDRIQIQEGRSLHTGHH